MPDTKVCSKCKEKKPLSEFYKLSGGIGFRSNCKTCINSRHGKYISLRYHTDEKFREAILFRQNQNNKLKRDEFLRLHPKCKSKSEVTREETCDILRQHHEALKNDPERLSSDFLKDIIGVDCDA